MENQVNALIALLSQAQDGLVARFGFNFAYYEVFYNEAQGLIDSIRYNCKSGDEQELSSCVNSSFALIEEIAAL
ncbi:hypothetical protein VPHF89G1_0007 [Vibrio phage F89 g1]